jgi:glycosyltransferase involved in cell wall biosynthesis
MDHKLAIVIPAFKSLYFRETLESIAGQTNKNFNLYIADDNSAENLKSIIDRCTKEINVIYKKFDDNLGSTNIVSQWKRSVELCGDEEWIWLFSDDDLMPDDAVERFMNFIVEHPRVELVRFNTKIIDKNSGIKSESLPHPDWETSLDFLKRRLEGTTYSFIVEYIFKKDLYKKNGGVVDFPAAWASDDATWALFGKTNGIYTIPGKPVLWRQSGINISSDKTKYAHKKIDASFEFLRFIKAENFEIEREIQAEWLLKQGRMLEPGMKLKWYFFRKVFTNNISPYFRFVIFNKALKNKIRKFQEKMALSVEYTKRFWWSLKRKK